MTFALILFLFKLHFNFAVEQVVFRLFVLGGGDGRIDKLRFETDVLKLGNAVANVQSLGNCVGLL